MKADPYFSVIIPCFNGEKYISRCLNSIISQNFENWECIIINDGSKDRSFDIISNYSNNDKRIKIINQQNSGVSIARNKGIEASTGRYLLFVDTDDILRKSDFLDTAYNLINSDNSIDIVQFDVEIVTPSLKRIKLLSTYPFMSLIETFVRGETTASSACSKFFSSQLIKNNEIRFPEKIIMNEDYYFSFVAMANSSKTIISHDLCYTYVKNDTSCTAKHNSRHVDSMLKVADLLEKFAILKFGKSKEIQEFISYRRFKAYSLYVTDFSILDFNVFRKNVSIEDMKLHKKRISKIIYLYCLLVLLHIDFLAYCICWLQPKLRRVFKY